MAEVHLSPKLLSDPAWVATRSMYATNLIMDYECHYQAVGYSLVHWDWSRISLQPYSTQQ